VVIFISEKKSEKKGWQYWSRSAKVLKPKRKEEEEEEVCREQEKLLGSDETAMAGATQVLTEGKPHPRTRARRYFRLG
jgi:hypothetical protein